MKICYTNKTDFELTSMVAKGDHDAFGELVERYKNLVYSVVLRMISDKEEANDQAQEVFIKLYKNIDKYRDEFKFSTWVIRIATNHVIDFRRRNKNNVEASNLEDLEQDVAIHQPSAEEVYLAKEQTKSLADAVESLPDMYKLPIVLYHQQGMSYQEISDIVGVPISKIKNRLFRARKLLKEALANMQRGESYV
ncbi:MAG: sigma-70 family RNA polymerase sigma factor [Defluviitaleaceae bacterium]|nr:sigma-70 family RNA polymerase sigma factor [Defluviitaleaceae bacterium]